jgi:hypothetical protein
MMSQNTMGSRIALCIIVIIGIIFSIFYAGSLPSVYAQEAVTNTPMLQVTATSTPDFTEELSNSLIGYDFSGVPIEAHASLYNAIISRPIGLLKGGTYFTVGVYEEENEWGVGYLAAAINNNPPDWENGIWFIVHKKDMWRVALEKTPEFNKLFDQLYSKIGLFQFMKKPQRLGPIFFLGINRNNGNTRSLGMKEIRLTLHLIMYHQITYGHYLHPVE